MDRIKNHTGTGEEALFEIVWRSGDVTWMPYYQIRHLRALEDYFDLLGVANALQLPNGRGNPPQENPQIFLGGMSYDPGVPMFQKPAVSFHDLKVDSGFSCSLVTFSPSFILYFLCDDPDPH